MFYCKSKHAPPWLYNIQPWIGIAYINSEIKCRQFMEIVQIF